MSFRLPEKWSAKLLQMRLMQECQIFGIRVAQNKLAVKFHRRCDGPDSSAACQGTVYAVVDATAGQRLADYGADEEAASAIACYAPSPDRFFTFSIASDQHHLEIVEATARTGVADRRH